jgi:hypothetical protein
MGVSCFDEAAFKDMFVSATSHRSGPDTASQGIVVTILFFILCQLLNILVMKILIATRLQLFFLSIFVLHISWPDHSGSA